jgi:heat shock protein HslJ
MIRPSIALLIGAALTLAVAACSSSGGASPTPAAALPGTSWTVTTIGGTGTVPQQPTIAFTADGTVSGTTGCNQYNGTYTVDGDKLTFSPLVSTRMACAEDAANAQEAAFTTALQGTATWSIDSAGNLKLAGQAEIVATPSSQPAS